MAGFRKLMGKIVYRPTLQTAPVLVHAGDPLALLLYDYAYC